MCADAARLPLRPPRHGTFLSISPTASSGPTLRGDSTSIGFSESFHAKVQRSFRTKARRLASDAEEKGGRRTRDEDIDEEKLTKDRVSWFGNKHIKSTESKVEVRLAPSGRRRVVPALILAAPPPLSTRSCARRRRRAACPKPCSTGAQSSRGPSRFLGRCSHPVSGNAALTFRAVLSPQRQVLLIGVPDLSPALPPASRRPSKLSAPRDPMPRCPASPADASGEQRSRAKEGGVAHGHRRGEESGMGYSGQGEESGGEGIYEERMRGRVRRCLTDWAWREGERKRESARLVTACPSAAAAASPPWPRSADESACSCARTWCEGVQRRVSILRPAAERRAARTHRLSAVAVGQLRP